MDLTESHLAYTQSCPVSIKSKDQSVYHASFQKYSHSMHERDFAGFKCYLNVNIIGNDGWQTDQSLDLYRNWTALCMQNVTLL